MFPQLVGSEKQIAWAAKLRDKMLCGFSPQVSWEPQHRAKLLEKIGEAKLAIIEEFLASEADRLRHQPAARWWIDHRDDSLMVLWSNSAKAFIDGQLAAEIALLKAERAAKAEADRLRIQEEREEENSKRAKEQETENDRSECACERFRPIRIEWRGSSFTVFGEDNHAAVGYFEDGDFVVYQIDDLAINTLLPNATALSLRARRISGK